LSAKFSQWGEFAVGADCYQHVDVLGKLFVRSQRSDQRNPPDTWDVASKANEPSDFGEHDSAQIGQRWRIIRHALWIRRLDVDAAQPLDHCFTLAGDLEITPLPLQTAVSS
jgi:hypothetical protein